MRLAINPSPILYAIKNYHLLAAHLSVLLFGFTGLFGKWITLSSGYIVLGRVAAATVFFGILFVLQKKSVLLASAKEYLVCGLLGVLWMLNLLCFYTSVQVSSVAIAVLSFSTFPVFTAFLEPLFEKKALSVRSVVIALITMVGVGLVVPSYDFSNNVLQGVLWGCVSGCSLSLISIVGRKYTKQVGSMTVSFYQNLVAAVCLLVITFFLPSQVLSIEAISLMVILGVVFSAVPQLLLFQSLEKLKASSVSVILSLESVYGIVLAMLFLNEIPSLRMILGGVIILGTSLYISLRDPTD